MNHLDSDRRMDYIQRIGEKQGYEIKMPEGYKTPTLYECIKSSYNFLRE